MEKASLLWLFRGLRTSNKYSGMHGVGIIFCVSVKL